MDIIDNNHRIEILDKIQKGELITAAALNSCVTVDSSIKRLEILSKLDEKKLKEKVESAFEHSLGSGHNAAGDLSVYILGFENIPRLETLRQARYEIGDSLLQKSTRRVDHKTIWEPESIRKNKAAHEIFLSTMNEVMTTYFEILNSAKDDNERKNLRQDAMFVTPLLLNTDNTVSASVRGWWQYLTEGLFNENIKMPEVIKEIASETHKLLIADSELFFRKWKSNYDPKLQFPTGSDFFTKRNIALEKILNSEKARPLRGGEKYAVLLDFTNPYLGITFEELKQGVDENDPGIMSALKKIKATLLTITDISTYHELIRQRTVDKTIEPFISAIERPDASFFIPSSLKRKGYEDVINNTYKKLSSLYFNLINEGVPKEDSIGVIPHSTNLYSIIVVDGWNAMHLAGDRLCITAKPSMIRWMRDIRDEIHKHKTPIDGFLVPKGETLGYCPDNLYPEKCKLCKIGS